MLSILQYAFRCRSALTAFLTGVCLIGAALATCELLFLGLAVAAVAAAVRSGSMAGAWGPVAGLSVILTGRCLAVPLSDWATAVLAGRLEENVTSTITGTLLASPFVSALEDASTQDAASQARGVNGMPVPAGTRIAVSVLQGRLAAAGSLVLVALFLSWWGAVVLLAALMLAQQVLSAAWQVEFRSWPDQAEAQRRASYLLGLGLGEAAKELRVFGLAGWLANGHLARWREAMSPVWAARRRTRARGLLAVAPLAGAVALLLWDLVARLRSGQSGVAAATSAAAAVIAALSGLNPQLSVLAQRGAQTLKALLALPGGAALARTPPGAAPADPMTRCLEEVPVGPAHSVRFEDVSFRYPGQDDDILAGLNLEIGAGESFALVGVNGAGKSTLVKLLAGVMSPTRGRITADGVDLRAMEPAQWQARVAVVMQDFLRLPLTVAQNVALRELEPSDTALMDRLAERAGFGDVMSRLPRGWDTPLDRNQDQGAELSGGQWQRLILVRALWAAEHGAGVLVLDEPAAALDIRAEAELVKRFQELSAGKTTLTVSHRFSVVRGADRIGVLDGGRIAEIGTHDDLLTRNGRYAAMFRAQASLYLGDAGNPARPASG